MGKEPEWRNVIQWIVLLHVSHFGGDGNPFAGALRNGVENMHAMTIRNEAGGKIFEAQRLQSAAGEVEIAKWRLNKKDSHQRDQNTFVKTRDWFRRAGVVALNPALAEALLARWDFPAPE